MLVLKKLSVKKLMIYLAIIIVMLGGTGFMLYQNQKLTNRKPLVLDDPTKYDKFMEAGIAATGSGAAPLADPLKANATSSQPLDINKVKNNKGIDATIFSSEKFQALKENTLIIQENSGLGKRDLFKPN